MKRLLVFLIILLAMPTLAQQACYFCNSQDGVRQVKFGRESYPLCNTCRNKPKVCDLCHAKVDSPELLQDGRMICPRCKAWGKREWS